MLQKFLCRNNEINVTRQIDGTPSKITFSVANGYSFDPLGTSQYSKFFSFGRKLKLYFGYMYKDGENWIEEYAEQGVYFVTNASLVYEREEDPILQVTAEDIFCIWDNVVTPAEVIDSQTPYNAISNIIINNTDFTTDDIAFLYQRFFVIIFKFFNYKNT